MLAICLRFSQGDLCFCTMDSSPIQGITLVWNKMTLALWGRWTISLSHSLSLPQDVFSLPTGCYQPCQNESPTSQNTWTENLGRAGDVGKWKEDLQFFFLGYFWQNVGALQGTSSIILEFHTRNVLQAVHLEYSAPCCRHVFKFCHGICFSWVRVALVQAPSRRSVLVFGKCKSVNNARA